MYFERQIDSVARLRCVDATRGPQSSQAVRERPRRWLALHGRPRETQHLERVRGELEVALSRGIPRLPFQHKKLRVAWVFGAFKRGQVPVKPAHEKHAIRQAVREDHDTSVVREVAVAKIPIQGFQKETYAIVDIGTRFTPTKSKEERPIALALLFRRIHVTLESTSKLLFPQSRVRPFLNDLLRCKLGETEFCRLFCAAVWTDVDKHGAATDELFQRLRATLRLGPASLS
mmetsp:Transcript_47068/g.110862  ORF Transcript_47068/g.110862 Transcript_47068/m.110862 type:complete len:231 (+) Transcript_47068:831-1523(+)